MILSIALAKIIGIYCILVGVAMLANPVRFKNMIDDFMQYPLVLNLAGIIALILGLILTVIHNVWIMDWRILITIVAWIILLKGVFRLFLPELVVNVGKGLKSSAVFYFITAALTLLVGLILGYYGFVAY